MPICLGGVVAGKLTNGALIRKNGAWETDSDYDLPLPMMHHSVISTIGDNAKMYVYGGQLPTVQSSDAFPTFPVVLRKFLQLTWLPIYYIEYSDKTDNCDVNDCRKWLRIKPPRRPKAMSVPGLFDSFSHTSMAQVGPKIHSVLNFCPTDGRDNGVLVEKWRSFNDDLGPVAEADESARKKRSTEGMIHQTLTLNFYATSIRTQICDQKKQICILTTFGIETRRT